MMNDKNNYFMVLGIILSIGLAFTIFGGAFVISEITPPEKPPEKPPVNFVWSINSTEQLIKEINERENNLSLITFTSGNISWSNDKGLSLEPLILFENDFKEVQYSKLMISNYNDSYWIINTLDDVSNHSLKDGYFYLPNYNTSVLNEKYTPMIGALNDSSQYSLIIGSNEWRLLHLRNYIEINYCYNDGTAHSLEIIYNSTQEIMENVIVTAGTWSMNNGSFKFSYSENMTSYKYEINQESHSAFEQYFGGWMNTIKSAAIEFVSEE